MCFSHIAKTKPSENDPLYSILVTKFTATYSVNIISFYFAVPLPIITIIPSGPMQGAMVGSPQDIQCIVSTVSGVELSSLMISWMGPGGESITNDSRVTISPTTSNGNNFTSDLQFTYLMEGDEGMYTCNVMILDVNTSDTFEFTSIIGKSCYFVYKVYQNILQLCSY